MSRNAARALAILLAASFICYGGFRIVRLGFYYDDWILLSYMRFVPPGFFSAVSGLVTANNTLWFRPLDAPLYAGLYSLFGLHPAAWQGALLLVNALTTFATGRLLTRYGVPERIAVLGALIFLAAPNKDATMFWPSVIINSLSLLAMLASYLSHLEYVDAGRRRFLCLSAALTLVSLCLYDQCAFFFLLWLITPRTLGGGTPPRAKRGTIVAAATTGAYLLYKFAFVPHVLDIAYNKTFSFSARHFVWIFYAGIKTAIGFRLGAFCLRALGLAFATAPITAGTAVVFPWLLLRLPDARPRPNREAGRALVLLGAMIYLLGYLPIAVSDYFVTPINHMNRLNEVPMLGLILAMIGLGTLKVKPRLLERGACSLASLLLAVHVGLAAYWVESYRRQNVVRAQVLENLARWPAGKTLLLMLPERYVAEKVPVFDAHYDITGAVQIWTGDPTRRADTVSPRMDFTPDAVVTSAGRFPYDQFMLLESARGIFTTITHRNFSYKAPGS